MGNHIVMVIIITPEYNKQKKPGFINPGFFCLVYQTN